MNAPPNSTPPESAIPPPHAITGVGPGEATAGTIAAGLLGAITAYVSDRYHIPVPVIGGVLSLAGSGAMAIWHHARA